MFSHHLLPSQISTDNYLNFSVFAGRTINVSFAMVSHLYGEAPVYSDPLTVWISDSMWIIRTCPVLGICVIKLHTSL